MLPHLVKKDFLIVKKYVLIMLVAAIAIPPVMLWRAPEYGGVMGFILSVIFAVFMLLQYVSLKEYQCPKASALLCAAPFPRRLLVLSKYIFCLLIYAICCLIFGIETMVAPQLGTLRLDALALMFLITAIVVGLYLPTQYKLGYEKTKFAFVVIIMASPVLTAALLKMDGMNFDTLLTAPPIFVYGGMILAGIIFLIISACLSIKFYNKADLA